MQHATRKTQTVKRETRNAKCENAKREPRTSTCEHAARKARNQHAKRDTQDATHHTQNTKRNTQNTQRKTQHASATGWQRGATGGNVNKWSSGGLSFPLSSPFVLSLPPSSLSSFANNAVSIIIPVYIHGFLLPIF